MFTTVEVHNQPPTGASHVRFNVGVFVGRNTGGNVVHENELVSPDPLGGKIKY